MRLIRPSRPDVGVGTMRCANSSAERRCKRRLGKVEVGKTQG